MNITLGEGITIATLLTSALVWLVRTSEMAKRNDEERKSLRADLVGEVAKLRSEIQPVVAIAQESLRQSSAAFRAVDALKAEYAEQREKWARVDERIRSEEREVMRWARTTDKFKLPDPGHDHD